MCLSCQIGEDVSFICLCFIYVRVFSSVVLLCFCHLSDASAGLTRIPDKPQSLMSNCQSTFNVFSDINTTLWLAHKICISYQNYNGNVLLFMFFFFTLNQPGFYMNCKALSKLLSKRPIHEHSTLKLSDLLLISWTNSACWISYTSTRWDRKRQIMT